VLEAVEMLQMLEAMREAMRQAMRRVLLYMLEALEGELCLLETSDASTR